MTKKDMISIIMETEHAKWNIVNEHRDRMDAEKEESGETEYYKSLKVLFTDARTEWSVLYDLTKKLGIRSSKTILRV